MAAALIAVALWPASAHAQIATSGSVRGRVVAGDGTPVLGALVELLGRADSVRTPGTGEFLFQGVAAGPLVLRIRALGYRQKSLGINVGEYAGWAGSIVLERVPQPLPEVLVTAPGKPPEFANTTKYDDFFRRRKLGFGTFRARDDFERMGATDIASVLKGIPGVMVTSTYSPFSEPEIRMRVAGCPGPALTIYVNGKQIAHGRRQADLGDLLSSFPLTDILFIEFYRSTGQIPSDFDRGNSCAALVIWTR